MRSADAASSNVSSKGSIAVPVPASSSVGGLELGTAKRDCDLELNVVVAPPGVNAGVARGLGAFAVWFHGSTSTSPGRSWSSTALSCHCTKIQSPVV